MLEHAVHIWSVAVSVAEFSSKIVPHQNVQIYGQFPVGKIY